MSDDDEMAEQIEANVARIVAIITNSAQHMAAKFNGPVYLVGSVLHQPQPRDVDVRVIVEDHEFGRRYGLLMKPCDEPPTDTRLGRTAKIHWNEDGPTQRWLDDCAKTGAEWSVHLSRNVDFKVWPASHWREPYPTPLTLAAPSPRRSIYNAYFPDPAPPEKASLENSDTAAAAATETPTNG